MSQLIIVEDQPSSPQRLKQDLEDEGYEVVTALRGQGAYTTIQREPADAVLLDLIVPNGEEISLLRRLRDEEYREPVLILSAKDSIQDRIVALDSGADDYVVKPIDFSELLARLRAIIRRSAGLSHESVLSFDNLLVDVVARRVTRDGHELHLPQRQLELLEYMLRNKNQVVSREALARNVWKSSTATWTNVIEVQVNQLRKKLRRPGWEPILHTVRGKGYVLGDQT